MNEAEHKTAIKQEVDVAKHALDFSPSSGSKLYIDSIHSMNQTKDYHIHLYFSTQKKYISFKLDTGADANILPLKEYERLCSRPTLNKTNSILTSYTNGKLNVYGVCEAEIQHKDRPGHKHKFFMVDTQKVPIISRQTIVDLGLVKFIFDVLTMQPCPDQIKIMINQYADLFEGIGQLPRVLEKANGNLRICLDPVDLNKNLKRPHYPIPTFESIAQRCAGAKIFSKLDATSGFWSMMLDDESSDLTTFNTICGCYKFKRLKAALERAHEKNVKFNQEKCVFGAKSIPYFGHLLTSEGIKPDPEKTRVITEMPLPENSEQLQKFLGMLNYLSRYIPNLSSVNKSVRELARADEYKWKPVQNIEIKVDASKHGLGAVLAVDDNVVAFGSRSMSETEQKYSQMKKELLTVVLGCKHFHQYIYGRTITIKTDHKPLESILVKLISKVPPRLQRMMLSIQPYSLKFVYRPGSEIPVADTLSRLHTPDLDNSSKTYQYLTGKWKNQECNLY
ncbi:hypothetical protein QYM36_010583 [Artemia franciscana]|uniref:RNA-directed DNA polymerase n=1 Tax=Artemia franciscana TaxID=6661 RepID=A0AA88L218_ARTSF|nr:hypothetical protein QYM36_010583 [Artemia franciscana]